MTKKAKAQLNKTLQGVEETDMLRELRALAVALQKGITSISSELENIHYRVNQRGGFAEIDDTKAKAALCDSVEEEKRRLRDEIEDLEHKNETFSDEVASLQDEVRSLEGDLDDREEIGRSRGYDEGYADGYESGYQEGRGVEADQSRMGA